MLRGASFYGFFLSKGFGEKCKHTELALHYKNSILVKGTFPLHFSRVPTPWTSKKLFLSCFSGGIMLIQTFVLKVRKNNERKNLTDHKIIIALQNKLSRLSLKCEKNHNCEFIRTYCAQVFHLLINLSSLTFALYTYRPWKRNFVKGNKKPFRAIKTITKHENLSDKFT